MKIVISTRSRSREHQTWPRLGTPVVSYGFLWPRSTRNKAPACGHHGMPRSTRVGRLEQLACEDNSMDPGLAVIDSVRRLSAGEAVPRVVCG